jgi:hypothetical protein
LKQQSFAADPEWVADHVERPKHNAAHGGEVVLIVVWAQPPQGAVRYDVAVPGRCFSLNSLTRRLHVQIGVRPAGSVGVFIISNVAINTCQFQPEGANDLQRDANLT